MGGGGSERTRVEGTQQPPQIAPEAREGFEKGQQFYKDTIDDPPIFTGKRKADVNPTQQAAVQQQKERFGGMQLDQDLARVQSGRTLTDDYLYGPGAQAAVSSLASPLFSRFRDETMPGIRDRSIAAYGSGLAPRRFIAEDNAINDFGEALGRGAIAPVYLGERENQMSALENVPKLFGGETLRLGQIAGAGATERGWEQELLDVEREIFEEPIFRRAGAADALLGAANFGPGSAGSSTLARQNLSTGQEIGQYVQMAATIAMIAYAMSARETKDDIVPVDGSMAEMMSETILTMPVSTWRYKWEGSATTHVGPMLDDMPEWMRQNSLQPHVLSMIGALIVTVQQLNARMKGMQKEIDELRSA